MVRLQRHRYDVVPLTVAIAVLGLSACGSSHNRAIEGIHKIKHVVMIMQENRSFDQYFGTYPGAEGIPMKNGVPTVCAPDPVLRRCVKPYVSHGDRDGGGPHDNQAALIDIDNGKMDGFLRANQLESPTVCRNLTDPHCREVEKFATPEMAYHTASDVPNYWAYAHNFVLQDHMFEPVASWSLPAALFKVSGWSATCTSTAASSCRNDLWNQQTNVFPAADAADPFHPHPGSPTFAWTDLTYLLHKEHVTWGYYVVAGTEPDCRDPATISCPSVGQSRAVPGIWNPLPYFATVQQDHQSANIQSVDRFYSAARNGTLPAVSWVVPSAAVSEHWPGTVSAGVAYVTSLINAVMNGPDWDSTAIFLAWDDWGGFYDNAVPPKVDVNGYGLRVPALVVSAYAKHGYIDHQTLSFDAYLKFIEDDFLNGQRLDPKTDGRPDPRPTVRESLPILGDLTQDFDFTQTPRPPMLLSVQPKTTLTK